MSREVFAIGSIGPDHHRVAMYCAWGDHWFTPEDEQRHADGAEKSHGCCEEHAALLYAEAEALASTTDEEEA